ncbi:MAG: VWA domain-containing protein, partial [Acidobacteriota bacterium]|nr:VWA domain-containing protein [Acidobacteriota bacterium]
DGSAQTISYFSRESNLPLTLGLLVDTSGSQRRLIDEERAASYKFFEQVLREDKDAAFVIHFDFEVELLQDITRSRKLLEQALEDLQTPQPQRRQPGRGYPGGGNPRPGGTDLYDAVMLSGDELMRKQTGRKALVLLTDGVDTGSKVPLSTAIESAQRADTAVYSVLFEDPEAYGGPGGGGVLFPGMGRGRRGGMGPPFPGGGMNHADGKGVLEQISRETGGRMFQVSRNRPLAEIYREIEEDLRNQYSLGYTPPPSTGSRYRHIHLATRQKGLLVQTREGYYPS